MKIFLRDDIPAIDLPGRRIWKAIGKESSFESRKITYGFAHFSAAIGPAEPHHHAEEICYVLDADNAWVHYGPSQDQLGDLQPLQPGTTMHIPEMEWHQFVCEEGGFLDIIFIYGQVDNIRPEENNKQPDGK